jgi:stearoyl-CoA desaturase (delta-9 desaturase)
MPDFPASLHDHRVQADDVASVVRGTVRWAPVKSLWFTGMALAALIGGTLTFSLAAFGVFVVATATVLLLGHSLGSHRKLIHDSYQCPHWLARLLVWFGVQVGLAGPLGLLRQHDLRDYAQRLPDCHPYLRHGRSFWRDAWWQLHCELQLAIRRACSSSRASRTTAAAFPRAHVDGAAAASAVCCGARRLGLRVLGVLRAGHRGVLGHWIDRLLAHNHGAMTHVVRRRGAGPQRPLHVAADDGRELAQQPPRVPGSARSASSRRMGSGWWALLACADSACLGLRLPGDLETRPEVVRAIDVAAIDVAASGTRGVAAHPVGQLHGR